MVFLTGKEYFDEINVKIDELIRMLDENPDEVINKEAGELASVRYKVEKIEHDYLKHIDSLRKNAESISDEFEF